MSAEFTVVASNAPGSGRSSDPPPRSACPGTQSASPPSQRLQRIRRMASPESVPTLLLCGDNNRRAPLHAAEALHLEIPTYKLVVLPGAAQLTSMEVCANSPNGEVLALLDASHGSSRHLDAQLLRHIRSWVFADVRGLGVGRRLL